METILVIKIGGNIIDDESALQQFLLDFAQIDMPKILIHGGGKIASAISKKLQVEPVMIEGRRVTDKATLDVVTMVYAGLINKKIVAQLQSHYCNALGLTGADANLIKAHKRIDTKIDYGFVGDIDQVNGNFLIDLLERNITPVIAPVTHDANGNLLNTNADTIATEIAVELSKSKKVKLVFCFEKNGLLNDINNDESIIHTVRLEEIEQLIEKQIITEGMLPKMANISHALKSGVEKVILCHAKHLLPNVVGNTNFGTIFTP